MITKKLTILNKLGIHARPAAQFVRVASRFQADVTVEKDDESVDGKSIMRLLTESDYVVLMDERGKQMRSVDFAFWMQKRMNSGLKRLCFVIGGPYGFSEEIYARGNFSLSLSEMTFSHQIVRAIFTEQIYRAFTILNNEPYHHE